MNIKTKWYIRPLYWTAGFIAFILGIAGIFLPGLPTTPFILLAAYCWARSSERLYARLLRDPRFGPLLADWQEYRAVPRRAKWLAAGMMLLSALAIVLFTPMKWQIKAGILALMAFGAWWMWRYPDRENVQRGANHSGEIPLQAAGKSEKT